MSAERNARAGAGSPAARTMTLAVVLIAEDERSIASLIAEVVAQAGYTPLVATNGRQALELAREQWPALVITDLMMPHLDGAALTATLRAEAATRGEEAPPIVLMTAANPQYARATGADAVLRKPFNLAELEALLRRFLERRTDDEDL